MYNDILHIGNFVVHGYGLMIGIGFLLAIVMGTVRAKRLGMEDEAVIDIAILAGICGFAGAKLLFVIVEFPAFIKDPLSVLGSSGFVVYGGIIAGVVSAWIYCKVKKINFLQYFDLIMPEVALAQGFGRLGCFLAGCCYGKETHSHFGVIFPAGSQAPAGVALIPTQLLSAAGDFLIVLLLLWFSHKAFVQLSNTDEETKTQKKVTFVTGDIGCLYLCLYGMGRFLIEFLRGDLRGAVGILSTSQFISVFIVALGATLCIYHHRREKKG